MGQAGTQKPISNALLPNPYVAGDNLPGVLNLFAPPHPAPLLCPSCHQVGGSLPGGLTLRGLSGGERKRLSIAAALITSQGEDVGRGAYTLAYPGKYPTLAFTPSLIG